MYPHEISGLDQYEMNRTLMDGLSSHVTERVQGNARLVLAIAQFYRLEGLYAEDVFTGKIVFFTSDYVSTYKADFQGRPIERI